MNRGMVAKLTVILGMWSTQVLAQETVLTVPVGAEITLKPVLQQRISEPTEVSVQPLLASEELDWPEYCLLSLTINPADAVDYSPGNMVCITAQRQIIEAIPEGEIQLGQCIVSQDIACAAVNLDPGEPGVLRLTEPLQMTLQPRNAF